ncbi:type II toxin-antitoxin system VapB family antitoxin [Sphingomonas sp. MMS24-JH45]
MGVQLNIKDPETVRLARELAGQTRRTVTETVRAALEKMADEREAEVARRRPPTLPPYGRSRSIVPPATRFSSDHEGFSRAGMAGAIRA